MKLSPLTLANLAVASYDPNSPRTMTLTGPAYEDAYVCITIQPGWVHAAFQGTDNREDMLKDAESLAPFRLPGVGLVPYGFERGAPALAAKIDSLVQPGWVLTMSGHSLGASQVAVVASILIASGLIPSALVLLACPRVGQAVAHLLGQVPRVYCFRNGPDPVPDAPIGWASATETVIRLDQPPAYPLIVVDWHSSILYAHGIAALALPDFDAQPAIWSKPAMTDTTAAPTVPPETFAEHLADIGHFLLSFFQSAAKVEQAALPAETAAADVAEAATGNVALIAPTNAAAGALETVGSVTTAAPTGAADALNKLGVVLTQAQTIATAATGKPASANVTAALTGIAAVSAALPSAQTAGSAS